MDSRPKPNIRSGLPLAALLVTLGLLIIGSLYSPDASAQGAAPECTYSDAIVRDCTTNDSPDLQPCLSYNNFIVEECLRFLVPTQEEPDVPHTLDTAGNSDDSNGLFRAAGVFGPLPGTLAIEGSVEDGVASIVLPPQLLAELDLNRRVLVEYNPVVFDNIVPKSGVISFGFPADRAAIVITVTATLRNGALYIETLPLSASASANAESLVPADVDAVSVPVPVAGLAVTGSTAGTAWQLAQLSLGAGFAFLGTARLLRRRAPAIL